MFAFRYLDEAVAGKKSLTRKVMDSLLSWHGSQFEFVLHFVRCNTVIESPSRIIITIFYPISSPKIEFPIVQYDGI